MNMNNLTCGRCAAFKVCLARDPEKTAHDPACDNFIMNEHKHHEGRTIVDLTADDPDLYGRRVKRHEADAEERRRFIFDTTGG